MSQAALRALRQALETIDRPGSFCVGGSAPAVLPGLEVAGLGPVGLPLTPQQAEELKKRCEQAPYGKGDQTLVDTSVRRVWRLTPDRFRLTNPDWEGFVRETVRKVQEGLGLERQKLQSHLYDLLLYEPGSFFLPHRDGEKLDRMVATLVIVLPSSFRGGELVVRHDGEEQVLDLGGADAQFRTYFAAFYADCEHEVRPLREGHRLCLVYNLTLARSKKRVTAPSHSEQVERVARALREWAEGDTPRKLVVTLGHQYTREGLAWDALKGVDRAKARALREGARRAGCRAHLALLTLHESGSAEYAGGGYGRGRWYEEDAGEYEMDEVFDTSLTAEHWTDPEGHRLPLGPLDVEEDEVLDPDSVRAADPEEEFEGYTGNEGMTLERWYRHAAVVLWPDARHFDVLCDAGSQGAAKVLGVLVRRWRKAPQPEADALRAQCAEFASTLLARWQDNPYPGIFPEEEARPSRLFRSLAALGEPALLKTYLGDILPRDAAVDPGKSLVAVCRKHGWGTFRQELESAFGRTTGETLRRNVRLLEYLCLSGPRKDGWAELCQALAGALVTALENIDRQAPSQDWRARRVKRGAVLARLARSLLASGQGELLARVVEHALARPEKYPLRSAHVPALTALAPWLKKNVKQPCPPLSHWLDSCRAQLEALTARAPEAPADFRRDASVSCKCADCAELKKFLKDPHEEVHRFRAAQARRSHLESEIKRARCDLDLRTEKKGSPHTLVCTKNTASYDAKVRTYQRDQERLETVRSIQASVPTTSTPREPLP